MQQFQNPLLYSSTGKKAARLTVLNRDRKQASTNKLLLTAMSQAIFLTVRISHMMFHFLAVRRVLTSFLHEGEEIVQEVLSLWILIYLVKLQLKKIS